MISYLKKNLLNFIIGCIIGMPLSLYAVNHQTPANVPVTCEIVEVVQAPEIVKDEELKVNFQSYEMTAEEIAEEEYFDSLELLSLCVEAEAGNQGLEGKRYVTDVIMNRMDNENFPDTITEVILQKNQFSVVLDGRIWSVEPTEETFQAVQEALEQRTNSEILYFTSEGFHPCGNPWKKIGDHYFSTE